MRDCPKCGDMVDGLLCKACGYEEPGARAGGSGLLCQQFERGLQCSRLGTLSGSTNGSGPWFCWPHAAHVHGGNWQNFVPRSRRIGPEKFESLRALTRRAAPVRAIDIEAEFERMAIQEEPRAAQR